MGLLWGLTDAGDFCMKSALRHEYACMCLYNIILGCTKGELGWMDRKRWIDKEPGFVFVSQLILWKQFSFINVLGVGGTCYWSKVQKVKQGQQFWLKPRAAVGDTLCSFQVKSTGILTPWLIGDVLTLDELVEGDDVYTRSQVVSLSQSPLAPGTWSSSKFYSIKIWPSDYSCGCDGLMRSKLILVKYFFKNSQMFDSIKTNFWFGIQGILNNPPWVPVITLEVLVS